MFAEFRNPEDRDMALAIRRSAGLKPGGGKQIWADQDRIPGERAARSFSLGLKRMLKEIWKIPYTVKVSEEAPYTVNVGGELALTTHASELGVKREWHGEWAS